MPAGAERAAIDRVLDAVRSGLSGTLVLRGGPGVGKSTLLEYAVAAAPDLRVCRIAGVESEISMDPNRRRCSASSPAACTRTASASSPASANLPPSRCSSSFRRSRGRPARRRGPRAAPLGGGGALSAQAVDRILADTRNNPLALVELGTQYTADQLSGRAVLPEPLPLGQRLQEHFLRQVRSLPPDAQAFALLAAADPAGDRDLLWRAAARAGIDPDAASAETAGAGVLEFPGSSVRFRYPLLRSAVYHGASAADRRHAHRALSRGGPLGAARVAPGRGGGHP